VALASGCPQEEMSSPASLGRSLLCGKVFPRCLWTFVLHLEDETGCKHSRGKFCQGHWGRKGPFIQQPPPGAPLSRERNPPSCMPTSLDECPNHFCMCWMEETRLSQHSPGSGSPGPWHTSATSFVQGEHSAGGKPRQA